jgi:hypothetical protein
MTAVSRRRLLVLGAPVLGASGLAAVAARTAAAAPPPAGFVSAPDLGIAPSNDPATNRANLVAALSDSAVCVVFPPGDYRVDNGGSAIVIQGYAGELVMQPRARLLFTDGGNRGLTFRGGAGARLFGVSVAFASPPAARVPAHECLTFDQSSDTHLGNVRIDGSAAAGLLFWRCIRPTVVGAIITNTMADGLHFANCQDGCAANVTTVDTGDDGVSFVNYASGPAHTGGLASNLSVTRSKSRGVAVVGQSGVTVRDVTVDTTVGHGLYCAQEPSWNTRQPDDVRFERARVHRGGAWTAAPGGGTNSGVRVDAAGAVTIAGVTVDASSAHGVHVTASTATISDVTVKNVTGSTGSGFNLQRGTYLVDRLSTEQSNGIGFFAGACRRVEYGTITVRNAAITHPTRRAVNLEHSAHVLGGRLWIVDDQPSATGYTVGAFGPQRGSLGTVVDLVDSRDVVVDNPSGLSFTRL